MIVGVAYWLVKLFYLIGWVSLLPYHRTPLAYHNGTAALSRKCILEMAAGSLLLEKLPDHRSSGPYAYRPYKLLLVLIFFP